MVHAGLYSNEAVFCVLDTVTDIRSVLTGTIRALSCVSSW